MSHFDYKPYYRRNLPHLQPQGATLFITFRLADSIPGKTLAILHEEQIKTMASLKRIADEKEASKKLDIANRQFFGKWDTILDEAKSGPLWLEEDRIATIVSETLFNLRDRLYTLEAFCIMPNHVHLLCQPLKKPDGSYNSIARILHSLKLFTARRANAILKRSGDFWQHESYDHVVRDENELGRIVEYILDNPVKAGLVKHRDEWKWKYWKHESD